MLSGCVEKRTGIVLKTYFPKKRKIMVLEAQTGKAQYVPAHEDICVGTLLEYYVPADEHNLFIYSVEKIGLPMLLARDDILFLHHIFELCYYYVPMGSPAPEVFALLIYLYQRDALIGAVTAKKLVLVKLFALLGIIPDAKISNKQAFKIILGIPVDRLLQEDIDLEMERDIDIWLHHCIALHPYGNHFKTTYFLTKPRNL